MWAELRRVGAGVRLVADRPPDATPIGSGVPSSNPPMSNQQAFDRGIASSPRDGAVRIPEDRDSHLDGIPLLDGFGTPIQGASGNIAQTPKAFSADFFYRRGQQDASLYADAVARWRSLKAVADNSASDKLTPEEAAGLAASRLMFDRSLIKSPLRRFGQRALWDAQRYKLEKAMPEFRDAASIYIGIYAAAAGIPLDMIQEIQDDYATFNSRFSNEKMDDNYRGLPERNVRNVDIGYGLVQNSRLR